MFGLFGFSGLSGFFGFFRLFRWAGSYPSAGTVLCWNGLMLRIGSEPAVRTILVSLVYMVFSICFVRPVRSWRVLGTLVSLGSLRTPK